MLEYALYPVIFPKRITECSANIYDTAFSEVFAATRYKIERILFKKILASYKSDYVIPPIKDLCDVKIISVNRKKELFYEKKEMQMNGEKSEYELDFHSLNNFYFINTPETYWQKKTFSYAEEIYNEIYNTIRFLREKIEEVKDDSIRDEMEEFFIDSWEYCSFFDHYPFYQIVTGDIFELMNVTKEHFGNANISDDEWLTFEKTINLIHEKIESVPFELKNYVGIDIDCSRGTRYWDFCGYSLLRYFSLPIAKEWDEYIKSNKVDSENELCKKATYIISLLDYKYGFYNRTICDPETGWSYEYEDFDIRTSIFFLEADLVFTKLNEVYKFSATKKGKIK